MTYLEMRGTSRGQKTYRFRHTSQLNKNELTSMSEAMRFCEVVVYVSSHCWHSFWLSPDDLT